MAELSLRVQNRLENVNHILTSIDVHGSKVQEMLLKEAKVPFDQATLKDFFSWLRSSLANQNAILEQKEKEYAAEQSDDAPKREERDRQFDESSAALSKVIHRIKETRGAESGRLIKEFGISPQTTKTPSKLHNAMSNTVGLLQASNEVFADDFGNSVSAKTLGDYLEKYTKALASAIEATKREERERQTALMERDHALVEWEQCYQSITTILEGLYNLSGLEELANRIRPTKRRRRGESTPTEPVNDPSLSTPTNTTPTNTMPTNTTPTNTTQG